MTFESRFWAKIDKRGPDECWLWTAYRDKWGYGRIARNGEAVRAPRVSYELASGSIPPGLLVCHRCDVPACVNPKHLFLGTNADNNADKARKGRADRERRHTAKLTWQKIPGIRALLAEGFTNVSIAAIYGVGDHAISDIRIGKAWPLEKMRQANGGLS